MQTRPDSDTLVYRSEMSKQEAFRVFKAVGIPIGILALSLFTIQNFAAFGTKLITPMIGLMWIVGFIVAFLMPSMRRQTLMQTLGMIGIYCVTLIGLKIVLGVVSGASSEMIAASYDQAIPMSTGNAIPGYLQTMMWFVAVLMPLGETGMQLKRLRDFKHNQSLNKTFGRVRGIRNSGHQNSRSIR